MNISQIKVEISALVGKSITHLNLQIQEDALGTPSQWLAHWDNDIRLKVIMHEDVYEKAKDPDFEGLAYKHETVSPVGKGSYTKITLITPRSIAGVL